jgi:hypothetical protein
MNIKNYLKQSSIYNVIEVESIISENARERISKISKKIIYIVVFLLFILYFFVSGKNLPLKEAISFVSWRLAGIVLINVGVIIFSKLAHFYLASTYYFEKIVENKYTKDELYTFSAGRILYEGLDTDILHGFIRSDVGKMVFSKLGIKDHDRRFLYKSAKIIENENVPKSSQEILKVKDIVNYLYFQNSDFKAFLDTNNVSNVVLLENTGAAVEEIEKKEYESEWWRKEFLLKKAGLFDHI